MPQLLHTAIGVDFMFHSYKVPQLGHQMCTGSSRITESWMLFSFILTSCLQIRPGESSKLPELRCSLCFYKYRTDARGCGRPGRPLGVGSADVTCGLRILDPHGQESLYKIMMTHFVILKRRS